MASYRPLLLAGVCAAVVGVAVAVLAVRRLSTAGADAMPGLNPRLLALEPNRWVELHTKGASSWRRQGHAGSVWDSRRGRLYIFGSDTHGDDWDNSVHEFDPTTLRWESHYPAAAPDTYRADEAGHAVAGDERLLPWAMHTFDNVVYDPTLDAIIVTALPAHNGAAKERAPGAKVHPTWIYDLWNRQWRIFPNSGEASPTFFAGGSAYDAKRDVVVAYSDQGVWELGPLRDRWRQATKESHHEISFNMVYDSKRDQLAIFGDYGGSSTVWLYTPGPVAGAAGVWEKRVPAGDLCPKDQDFPVAFDSEHGIFLLVTDDRDESNGPGEQGHHQSISSSTYIYDVDANSYQRLPRADLPPLGMNYMMVYDQYHRVFLLVTGDWRAPAAVWALNLAPEILPE